MNDNRLNRNKLSEILLSKNLISNDSNLTNFASNYLKVIDLYSNEITSIDKVKFNGLANFANIGLSGNKITSIEKDTFNDLTNLTHINLSNKKITSIDRDTFSNLTNLTHIDLSGNKITSIDKDAFNNLINLTHMYLFSNEITSIEKDTFDGLTNLTHIDLSHNKITSIDKDTFNGLTNLTHIDLSHKKITSIDRDTFSNLTNLTHIDLSGNKITSIDKDAFNNLINLTHMYLFSNEITSIEKDTFDGLTNLTHIILYKNKITSIEKDTFNNLTNLTHIDLSHNKITSIDKDAFNNLINLNHMYLFSNEITSIEKDTFNGLINLTHIDLYKNKITSIVKDTFNGLINLTHMYLSSNGITSIEKDTFNNLTNLTHIDLSHNKITSIEKDTFNGLIDLTHMFLFSNEITSIDKDTFNGLTNLTHINLSSNGITSIEKDTFNNLTNLTDIDLSHNKITSIDKDAFNNLINLNHMYLSSNEITSIKDIFNGLTNLTHIILYKNKITSIEKDTFNNLTNLTHIDLSHNKITSIDKDAFNNLINLNHMYLFSNEITSIEKDTFDGLINLTEIGLSSNGITSIEKDIFNNLTNLVKIYFHPISIKIDSNIFNGLNKVQQLTLFDEKVINNPIFKPNQEISKENVNLFFGKTLKINPPGLCLNFTRNSLNSVNLEVDEWKCYKKPFKWENIPDKISVLIGKNGTGKTSLLKLINDSINSKENKDKSFISKYYFCSNDSSFNQDANDYLLLLFKNIDKNDKEYLDKILDNFYDKINEFSVIQYFDFLILKDYIIEDTQISRFKFQNITERKEQLLQMKYTDLNTNIEYYLVNNSKDYKLSPGEYLIVLIELWRIHAKRQKEINEIKKRPINNKLRILLLDEPDAHMHPSLIKEFIDLISSNDLDYLNLQVIMTTHNPVTVNFINLENIFELKIIEETNHREIVPVKEKSIIIQNLSDNLFFIKEKFKIVFIEGQLNEDKAFYEFVFKLSMQQKKNKFPVKFKEMGSKMFKQLFIKNNDDPSLKLDEFLFGINDGDYQIEEARVFFQIKETDDCIDNYQDNFKRLNRYCMENYIYDPINLFFALNHLINTTKQLKKEENHCLFNDFVDFTEKIKKHKKILDFINNSELNAVNELNSILEKVNFHLFEDMKTTINKKFFETYELNKLDDDKLNEKLNKEIKINFDDNETFELNYYPILLYASGKDLAAYLNEKIVKKVYNFLSNNSNKNCLIQSVLTQIDPIDNINFNPIDYFFALKFKLNEYETILKEKNNDNHFVYDEINKIYKKIKNFLHSIYKLEENSNLQTCVSIKEFILNENNVETVNTIINNTDIYFYNKIQKEKYNQILNAFKIRQDLNDEELFILKYCSIYNFMNKFNTDKIRNKLGFKQTEIKIIFEKVIEKSDEFKNQVDQNTNEFRNEIMKNGLSFNFENKNGKEVCESILETFNRMDTNLKTEKIVRINNGIELKYNKYFQSISSDLLKQIYLADFDFALTFSKSTIIKAFDQSGFLLDNGLKDIMKSIMESN
jgi:Leucine-rich repeat (LRR) protein/energy-coupling factor transporter ATP-binding protein EcfA2